MLTFRCLSFCFSVAFSLEGDHLDPKIHSTHQGIWRGIDLGAFQGLCWNERDIYGELSYSSVLDLPRATFFHVFFKQFSYSLFFPLLDPSYSLMIITSSLFQIHNSTSYQKRDFFFLLVLHRFSRSWSYLLCMEISLNKAGNNLVTERQMLSQQKQAKMNSSQGESQQVLRPVLLS